MIERTNESVQGLVIETTEHKESLKRLDKIDDKLTKLEGEVVNIRYLLKLATGCLIGIGGIEGIKWIIELVSSMHHTI